MKTTPVLTPRATRGRLRRTLTGPVALACLIGGTGASLFAQTAPPPPAAPAAGKGEEVVEMAAMVSTGTRFNDRTVLESPVPIDVIPRAELTRTGSGDLSQQLQSEIPSFNFPRPSLTDGSDHIRPATLRGLAPDQVLVLVNGKRRHTSALVNLNGSIGRGSVSTDFNAIPTGAIERVEVLRDGASAQYGSDAIAGVINVILRKDLGWGVDLAFGQTKEGDGADYKLDAFSGVSLGGKGSLFTNIWLHDHGSTSRIQPDTRQQYFGSGGTLIPSGNFGSGTGLSAPAGTLDPREAAFNRTNHRYGDPRSNDQGIWLNGDYPLTDDISAYFFGGGSNKHANSAGFFRRAGDDRTVRAIYPDGYLPFIQTDIEDRSIGGGFKGKVADWNWDLSSVYGTNDLEYRTSHSVNVTLGAQSPTSFYDGRLKFEQWTNNLDLTNQYHLGLPTPLKVAVGAEYRREAYIIGAGELASYVNGGVPILDGPDAGNLGAVGAQVFPGFKPSDAGEHLRNAKAGYLDFEQDINSRLMVSAAGRFEDYSDFGNNTTGKIAARVKITDTFALRGSLSNGFRAPHLAQEWFSSTATNFINGQPFDILTFPVANPAAKALGATALKPEKSTNKGGGFTWNPMPNFSASVDYYHIAIDDRIVLSSNFTGNSVIALLAAQGITGVGGGRYFTNAVDTTTEGVDLSARYVMKTTDYGRFTLTAGYNHNTTKATRIKQAPPNLAAVTTIPLFDLTETTRLVKGQPRDAANTTLTWDFGKWSILARETRFGQVSGVAFSSETQAQIDALTPGYKVSFAPAVPATVGGTTTNQQVIQTFGAKFLTDLDVGYKLNQKIRLSVGANNLFNIYPDQNIRSKVVNGVAFTGSDNVGIFPYTAISPFGFNGASYYVKASFRY